MWICLSGCSNTTRVSLNASAPLSQLDCWAGPLKLDPDDDKTRRYGDHLATAVLLA